VCVKNIGEGCATHVRVIPTIDYAIFGRDKHLSDFALFSERVNIIPPQYELTYPLNTWLNIQAEVAPCIELDIHYDDLSGANSKYQHFILPFHQITTIYSTPPSTAEERIPYFLNEIHKELKHMNQSR
jgi:hypothetical protein